MGCLVLCSSWIVARAEEVDFAQDVQPIFKAHCYECHGAKKQESGLRLDQPVNAEGHEQVYGPAIVAGTPNESILLQAVTGTHEELGRMPPEGDPLTAEQIAVLRLWIEQGANWPTDDTIEKQRGKEHWAFKRPTRSEPPAVQNSAWCRNAIDRFVLARLVREGLTPSPEADKITLLRRLSLDLIGLPPSVEEIDAFLADDAADVYERQVERLLASPHYGERWGRHWLDAARYADSDGYEKDKSRNVWFYRDWVIDAFNSDLPYDQFIVEQIAGDLLPNATQNQIVATGFLRNSMLNEEGGIDPEQFRMEQMFDRIDCIGKSVLGLTIQCAQCHNHKFDPLKQEEYYRLFAFLNNDHEPQRVVYTPPENQRRAELVASMRQIEDELRHRTPDWETQLASWIETTRSAMPRWQVLEPTDYLDVGGGAKLTRIEENKILCAGYAPTKCTYRIVVKTSLPKITAARIEALTDPNLPARGPGRSFKGTFGLTEFKAEAIWSAEPDKKIPLKFAAATADFEQAETQLEANFDDRSGRERVVGPARFAIDGKEETAWGIDAGPGRRNQDRAIVFQLETPLVNDGETTLEVSISQNHGGWNSDDHQNNLLGTIRIAVTDDDAPLANANIPSRVQQALAVSDNERSPAELALLFSHWRTIVPEWKEENDRVEALWQQWPEGSTALVTASRSEPRTTRMLSRGDFLKPAKEVAAGVPSFLHPLPEGAPSTRLTFARWLVAPESPTTARVLVNRVWQTYFGVGLVNTPEDFGLQCDPAAQRELLDWMACEFVEQGYHIKNLHRLIVASATYRQSSHASRELYERDPDNRLLARGSRFRVEGEIVRDVALTVSGLLNRERGGPSVFPPIPRSVLSLSYGPMTWNEETGPNRYRRAVYTFRRRSIPFPMLQNFDTPNGDFSCVRRLRSNTPLQALTTLNEVVFMECAQALARTTLEHGGDTDDQRLAYAFRCCVSREPDDKELAELTGLLKASAHRVSEGWTNAALVATGMPELPTQLPPNTTPTHWAAYTLVSRVLLNLDETITRE